MIRHIRGHSKVGRYLRLGSVFLGAAGKAASSHCLMFYAHSPMAPFACMLNLGAKKTILLPVSCYHSDCQGSKAARASVSKHFGRQSCHTARLWAVMKSKQIACGAMSFSLFSLNFKKKILVVMVSINFS